MEMVNGDVDGHRDVTGILQVNGNLKDTAVVHAGGRLIVNGQTEDAVSVFDGGSFVLSGVMEWGLVCRGGSVKIAGTILGSVIVDGGEVLIAEGSSRLVEGQMKALNSEGQWVEVGTGNRSVHFYSDTPWWRWNENWAMTLAD